MKAKKYKVNIVESERLSKVQIFLIFLFLFFSIATIFITNYFFNSSSKPPRQPQLRIRAETRSTIALPTSEIKLVLNLSKNTGGKVYLKTAKGYYSDKVLRINRLVYQKGSFTYTINAIYQGNIVFTNYFDFNEYEFYDSVSSQTGVINGTVIKFPTPVSTLEAPYRQGYGYVIIDNKTGSKTFLSSTIVANAVRGATKIIPAQTQVVYQPATSQTTTMSTALTSLNGYLDILFIPSGYTDITKFQGDVSIITKHLLTVAPFADYINKIHILSSKQLADLGCKIEQVSPTNPDLKSIKCDESLVAKEARRLADSPYYDYDAVVVIFDEIFDAGRAFLLPSDDETIPFVAVTSGILVEVPGTPDQKNLNMLPHELGHLLARLQDEYVAYYVDGNPVSGWTQNCIGTQSAGWYRGCYYQNLYRSTNNNCLMKVQHPDDGNVFCKICKDALKEKIESFTIIPPTPSLSCYSGCMILSFDRVCPVYNGVQLSCTCPPDMICTAASGKCVNPNCPGIGKGDDNKDCFCDSVSGSNQPPAGSFKKVFITSKKYNGNLGGLEGANIKCNQLAITAGLSGSYKAWLSSETVDAKNRLTIKDKPYYSLKKTTTGKEWIKIADNLADLLDSNGPQQPIVYDEYGNNVLKNNDGDPTYRYIHTGTNNNGTRRIGYTCKDTNNISWMNATGYNAYGTAGDKNPYGTDLKSRWSLWSIQNRCGNFYQLYCFED